jgi:molecular chaperone DnaK
MQRDAEAHATEDAKHREEIEVRNTADTLAYNAEKILRDNKDKISDDLNTEVEGKVKALRDALQGSDIEAIRRETQALNEVMQKIGQTVYGQQEQPGTEPPPEGGEGTPPPGGESDGTVEGEFREV